MTWYAGLLHLSIPGAACVFIALFVVMLLRREIDYADVKEQIHWDLAFLAGFLYLLWIRFCNPAISFAEKFMDHAFLAR